MTAKLPSRTTAMNAVMKTISSLIKAGNLRASLLFVCLFIMPIIASAQAAKLSLADLLVGLRSQKVSLEERNRILSEAIKERGVTFTTSAVIESELIAAGASQVLIDALRQVAAPKPQPTPAPTPIPTPTPPDWSFYVKRAEENVGKGELQLALADFDKAAEMRSDSSQVFAGRARTHFELKSYDKAIADYDRVVELLPKDPAAYYFRGLTYERAGNIEKALADYRTAASLDPKNENAAASVRRLEDAIAKAAEAAKPKPPPVAEPVAAPVRPQILDIGTLTSVNAERLVTPTYPPLAHRSNIEGRVVVEVELDVEGKVTSAKATTGHQMLRGAAEDAARRSRFKPAVFDGTPIRARGILIFNFSLKASE